MNTNAFYIGVGIDTARYGHHASFLDEDKRTAAKSFYFKEGSDGYQEFRQVLDMLRGKHPNAKFFVREIMAAKAQYAELLKCRATENTENFLGFAAQWTASTHPYHQRHRSPNCRLTSCENGKYRPI